MVFIISINESEVAYARKNDIDNATIYLKKLTEHSATPDGFRMSAYLLFTYAALGDKEKAFDWIAKAIENKSPLLLIYFVDPLVNSLKADSRYAQFQKLIFPEIRTKETMEYANPIAF